jgi:hypothetical protein
LRPAVHPSRQSPAAAYAETVNRAAMMLVAFSFRPKVKPLLVFDVVSAVELRGGRLEDGKLLKFDLRAVLDDVADRAAVILSAAMQERLPGIADEVDDTLGTQLRCLIATTTQLEAV